MTSLWHNVDVICQLNYTKLISLWFSTILQNFIPIPWVVLELWGTLRPPPPGPGTQKKPGSDRVSITVKNWKQFITTVNSIYLFNEWIQAFLLSHHYHLKLITCQKQRKINSDLATWRRSNFYFKNVYFLLLSYAFVVFQIFLSKYLHFFLINNFNDRDENATM